MTHMPSPETFVAETLEAALRACRRIPPAWPLQATVAVNPYLGFAEQGLAQLAARMERIGGPRPLMPSEWYRDRLASGDVTDGDIAAALSAGNYPADFDPAAVRLLAAEPSMMLEPISTLGELLAARGERDLASLARDRISAFAQSWFDVGQAMWRPASGSGAYAAWREFATHDLVPEFCGLDGFCRYATTLPTTPGEAVAESLATLGIDARSAESYCLQLLYRLGGWSEAARLPGWKAEQEGGPDDTLLALLAASLAFETACLLKADAGVRLEWAQACERHAQPVEPSRALLAQACLQAALEEAGRRALGLRLSAAQPAAPSAAKTVKAYFCIDVRSEVFRRHLESVSDRIETGGFAGFFGVGASHRRYGSVVPEHRLPVLLQPRVCSEVGGPEAEADRTASRIRSRARRALQRFSQAAVASFAYVEAAGLGYAARLAGATLARPRPVVHEPAPSLVSHLTNAEKVSNAAAVLKGMSLTQDFPATVLLIGHGASVTNNPFASALACGACGGHAGDVNARLLAALLNDGETRSGLSAQGIEVPADTVFVAGLHDTTSDEVTLFVEDVRGGTVPALTEITGWLARAAVLARTERAARLPGAGGEAAVRRRGADWSEMRPEWGLAGCSAFIAAPRAFTRGRALDGRAFLHDYDWRADEGFGVLELILTAPVVVASWISLQYYGSSVAPRFHGSGNKLLHNVVSGIGVLEGNGGSLRTGLPWQSVHDGRQLVHQPLRLTVVVAAPEDAVDAILDRHDHVRALFDNGWLALVTLDDSGSPRSRYRGGLTWTPLGDWVAAT